MDNQWKWADLTAEQLKMVMEAEKTLGSNVEYLVAYQHDEKLVGKGIGLSQSNQQIAHLTESQIECLRGLEKTLGTVVIAYR